MGRDSTQFFMLTSFSGLYSYLDDVGERHSVRYAAGAGTGFEISNAVPDNPVNVGYSNPLYKAHPKTRGKMSVQRGPGGTYKLIAAGPDHRRAESRAPDGLVRGTYSFLDDKGVQRTVEYIAGAGIGYRVVNNRVGPGTHINPSVADFRLSDTDFRLANDFGRGAGGGLGPAGAGASGGGASGSGSGPSGAGGGGRARPAAGGSSGAGAGSRGSGAAGGRGGAGAGGADTDYLKAAGDGSRDDAAGDGAEDDQGTNDNGLGNGADDGGFSGNSGGSSTAARGKEDRRGYAAGGGQRGSTRYNGAGGGGGGRGSGEAGGGSRAGAAGSRGGSGGGGGGNGFRESSLGGSRTRGGGSNTNRVNGSGTRNRNRFNGGGGSGGGGSSESGYLPPTGSSSSTASASGPEDNYNLNDDDVGGSLPPLVTANHRILEIDRDREWVQRHHDSTVIRNVGKWYVGLPPGQSVRAHVQNIDLVPLGGRVSLSPSEALRQDEIAELTASREH